MVKAEMGKMCRTDVLEPWALNNYKETPLFDVGSISGPTEVCVRLLSEGEREAPLLRSTTAGSALFRLFPSIFFPNEQGVARPRDSLLPPQGLRLHMYAA